VIRRLAAAYLVTAAATLGGCEPPPPLVYSQLGDVQLRAMQSRVYPITDRNVALRAAISTLQDQGYSIDSVEANAGTVTATKLAQLRLSAAAYPRGTTQTVIRANAIVMIGQQGHQVDSPEFYQQDFFDGLSRSVALNAAAAPADDASPAPAVLAITPTSITPGSTRPDAAKDAK
jgi:hypothetical protein